MDKKEIAEVIKDFKSNIVNIRREQDQIIDEYKKEIKSKAIDELRNNID